MALCNMQTTHCQQETENRTTVTSEHLFVCLVFPFFFSKLHIENDTTSWAPPDMTYCKVVVSFPDLDNVTVTPGKWVCRSFSNVFGPKKKEKKTPNLNKQRAQ